MKQLRNYFPHCNNDTYHLRALRNLSHGDFIPRKENDETLHQSKGDEKEQNVQRNSPTFHTFHKFFGSLTNVTEDSTCHHTNEKK